MSARTTRTSASFTGSLGVGCFFVGDAGPAEPTRIEQREIERRLAVEQPLRDVAAGGRRVLEAVAAEPDGHEEALDTRSPSDNRVVVGRERSQAGPAAGDAPIADGGHT